MYERRLGNPRSDIERAMQHYGVSYEEAERGLQEGRYVLPARGTRLTEPKYALYLGIGLATVGAIVVIWQLSK